MLLGQHTATDASPQQVAHEFVKLRRGNVLTAFHHSKHKLRNDHSVFLQQNLQQLTKELISFDRVNDGKFTKSLEGLKVELVHFLNVRICSDYEGQRLKFSDSMGYTDSVECCGG